MVIIVYNASVNRQNDQNEAKMNETKLENLLSRIGWSKNQFAEMSGVTPKTMGRWCKNGNPLAERYLELCCRLLGV